MLKLATNLELPMQQAGTQTYAWIARKGAGKSYGAGKLVELLHGTGVPVIVIDPVGIWWGLRLGADGASPGLSIPVIGGLQADILAAPGDGERLAAWLIGHNGSAVIDVSQFRKAERKRFVAEFAEALFHAAKAKRRPRMIVLEEAQLFAPQQSQGQERMLGAIEDIVRLGRNYGIGSMLVSQRPQSVNKEVLNQVECLFVGQLPAKHERDAIRGWVVAKGDERGEAFLAKLPSLEVGDFFAWSPQWLKCLEPIRVLPKETFDASSTPTLDDEEAAAPAELPDVALEGLRALLAPEAQEPKAKAKTNGTSDHTAELAAALARVEELEAFRETFRRKVDNALATLRSAITDAQSTERHLADLVSQAEPKEAPVTISSHVPIIVPEHKPRPASAATAKKHGKAEDAILAALHHRGPMGKVRLALLCGYKHSAGHFSNTLGALRSAGLIQQCWPTDLTTEGRKRAKGLPAPMSGRELRDYWGQKLGAVARCVLGVMPDSGEIERAKLADKTGYADGTGHWSNGLGALRSHGLIQGKGRLSFGAEIRADL